jgi:hypothetical protein
MLKGNDILLREAEETDRRQVYEWLALSDLTPSMMGPPAFPDHPIPINGDVGSKTTSVANSRYLAIIVYKRFSPTFIFHPNLINSA